MRFFKRTRRQAGFSLLEIMIAMTIMSVAFGAILTAQSGAIIQATHTRDLNVAGWIAHDYMASSEHLLEGKPFTELKEVESGPCPAPYESFTCKREVREPKFPNFNQISPTKEGEGVSQIVMQFAQNMSKYLNDNVRELVVTVTWKQAAGEQHVVLTTYLVDLTAEFQFTL